MKITTDSYFTHECEQLEKYTDLFKKKYPELRDNKYPPNIANIFERYLSVYGHAYCMDIKSERKKTAKILCDLLFKLNNSHRSQISAGCRIG